MAAISCFSACITREPAPAVLPRPALLPSGVLLSRRWRAAVVLRAAAVSRTTSAEAEPEAAKKRQPRGITKPRPVSHELQVLLGVKEIPRTQALKQIWAYIKENNLQDPENKRVIVCDEMLKKIFGGRDRVGFLEISGLLNPHFLK
ncbi:protein TRI1-like [Phoenix dactylifera]|uniref:Protein TRI1-like n=1 Tax=Phoenix dactylifera TaxID=42345 RepID=A0A8B7C289_PHODC|nr:protein TRI1-like [Phoenix dactylifera]